MTVIMGTVRLFFAATIRFDACISSSSFLRHADRDHNSFLDSSGSC